MLGRARRQTANAGSADAAADRTLEVTAAMQGTLAFKDPVDLRISGQFDGTLETLGTLTIGEQARVQAQITGETIIVAGRVDGKIVARRQLTLRAPARVTGEVWTPRLVVESGASLDGACHMREADPGTSTAWLTPEEVAQYLEIEPSVVRQWAAQGRIPAVRDGDAWRFEKVQLDQWIASERAK